VLHNGRCRLRPAQKRGSARLGEGVDSPLDRDEPPIDVAAQDFRSVWYVRLKVPGTSRPCARALRLMQADCQFADIISVNQLSSSLISSNRLAATQIPFGFVQQEPCGSRLQVPCLHGHVRSHGKERPRDRCGTKGSSDSGAAPATMARVATKRGTKLNKCAVMRTFIVAEVPSIANSAYRPALIEAIFRTGSICRLLSDLRGASRCHATLKLKHTTVPTGGAGAE
jgi:hypothetical protein